MQAGISQIRVQDMSVLAWAATTLPLLCILGFEGLTNRGPNTPALYLYNCYTINLPSSWKKHLRKNPIYRHLSQPDRTRMPAVQPHSQGSFIEAAPVKELMPCNLSQQNAWCCAYQFLPEPASDSHGCLCLVRVMHQWWAHSGSTDQVLYTPSLTHMVAQDTSTTQDISEGLDSGRTLSVKQEIPPQSYLNE